MSKPTNPLNIIRVRYRVTLEAVLLTEENLQAVAEHYGGAVVDRSLCILDEIGMWYVPIGHYLTHDNGVLNGWHAGEFANRFEPIPAPAPDLLGEAREIVEFWENREHTEDFAPWRMGPLASARNRAGSLVSAHRDWSNATNDDYWRYVTPEVWADALARARAWKAGQDKESKQ
jgi:hypothetical protein